MTEAELRSRLLADPVPGEVEAGERSWALIRRAYGSHERKPWLERHSRAVLALAAVAALGVAAVTPPGRALVERFREAAGVTPSQPALVRLPAAGRVLVDSGQGPWVVKEDGSKRRLGSYDAAAWSPSGRFVVATQGGDVIALQPEDGEIRWTVPRPGPVGDARWAPSGYRIAYREGRTLRIVAGDSTNDRLFARGVTPVAPAWFPDASRNVLAYAEAGGRIRVVDVDTRFELWSASFAGTVAQLAWSAEGSRLLVVGADGGARLYNRRGREAGRFEHVTRAAYSPVGGTLAYATYDPETDSSSVRLVEDGRDRILFPGSGRFEDLAWSPNGRWLLVTWPAADQWLFFRTPKVSGLVTVPNVRRSFDPGETGPVVFPRVSGWAPG